MKKDRFKVIIDNQGKVQEVLIRGHNPSYLVKKWSTGKMTCNIVKDEIWIIKRVIL